MEVAERMVLLKCSQEFAILYPSGNEVIALNALVDGLIIKTIFLDSILINRVI